MVIIYEKVIRDCYVIRVVTSSSVTKFSKVTTQGEVEWTWISYRSENLSTMELNMSSMSPGA